VRIRVIYEPATGKVVTAFPDNNPMPPYKRLFPSAGPMPSFSSSSPRSRKYIAMLAVCAQLRR